MHQLCKHHADHSEDPSAQREVEWKGRTITVESLAGLVQANPISKKSKFNGILADSIDKAKDALSQLPQERSAGSLTSGKETRLQRIVESQTFRFCSGLLIILNGVVMGMYTDHKPSATGPGENKLYEALENFFIAAFSLELGLKMAFYRCQFFKRCWNLLDLLIVGTSLVEAFILPLVVDSSSNKGFTIFRLLRVVRLVRLLKLIRAFKPLYLLVTGLMNSLPSLVWGLALMVLIIYMSAIFLTQQLQSYEGDELVDYYWGSIGRSMFSLFQVATGDGWASEVARPIIDRDPTMVVFFVAFVFLTQFACLNVMVAVIVNSVIDSAFEISDQERCAQDEQLLRSTVLDIYQTFHDMDENQDGLLTKEEFVGALQERQIVATLNKVGIPVEDIDDFFDLLDYDKSGTISLMEFVAGTMQSRGPAKAKDMLMINCEVHRLMNKATENGKAIKSLSEALEKKGTTVASPASQGKCAEGVRFSRNVDDGQVIVDRSMILKQLENIELALRQGIDHAAVEADAQAMPSNGTILMQLKSIERALHCSMDFAADNFETQTETSGRCAGESLLQSHVEIDTSPQACIPLQNTVSSLEEAEAHLVRMLDAFLPQTAAAVGCLTTIRAALGRPSAGAPCPAEAARTKGIPSQVTATALEEAELMVERMHGVFLHEAAAARAFLKIVRPAPGLGKKSSDTIMML